MMSLHREKVNANKNTFIQDVINMFGIKRRNLQFLGGLARHKYMNKRQICLTKLWDSGWAEFNSVKVQ
jgi:hypothetical protein